MSDELRPLRHHAYKNDNDEALAREARQHVLRMPQLQLVGELLSELRQLCPSWWRPSQLRSWWPASTRMLWLAQRPDLRQQITTDLTGLSPRAARRKAPYFQAELLDAVVNESDIGVAEFEAAFDPFDIAVYGPAASIWRRFRTQVPFDSEEPQMRSLMAWLLNALTTDKSCVEGAKRKPIISAHDLRTSIDHEVWHTCMPLEIRVAVDEARFAQEKHRPGRPFLARHELGIARPEHITAHIPLAQLEPILDSAEAAMGFHSESEQGLLPYDVDVHDTMPVSAESTSVSMVIAKVA